MRRSQSLFYSFNFLGGGEGGKKIEFFVRHGDGFVCWWNPLFSH
jgi:hypothetical protein